MFGMYYSIVCGVVLALTAMSTISSSRVPDPADLAEAIQSGRSGAILYEQVAEFMLQRFGDEFRILPLVDVTSVEINQNLYGVGWHDRRYFNELVPDVLARLQGIMDVYDDWAAHLEQHGLVYALLSNKIKESRTHFSRCYRNLAPNNVASPPFGGALEVVAAPIVAVGMDHEVMERTMQSCQTCATLFREINEFMAQHVGEEWRRAEPTPAPRLFVLGTAPESLEDGLFRISNLNRGYIEFVRDGFCARLHRAMNFLDRVLSRLDPLKSEDVYREKFDEATESRDHILRCYLGLERSLSFAGHELVSTPTPGVA